MTREQAEEYAKYRPFYFFGYRLRDKYPDLEMVAAKNLIKLKPYAFFRLELHKKYPKFLLLIGENK